MSASASILDRHRIVGTCAVYRKDSGGKVRYLILKRRMDLNIYPGLWTVPGGGMERSAYEGLPKTTPDGWENPLDAAVRQEVREEAGVEVGALEYLSNFTFIQPGDVPVFGVRFFAEYQSGEPSFDPEDSTELRWIAATEAPQFKFLDKVGEELGEIDALLASRAS